MKPAGEDLQRVVDELGIPWETDDYQTLPDFKPCPSFRHPPPHDLYLMNLKLPQHALSHTHINPLLSSLSARHRDLSSVMIHPQTAGRFGIADGDRVTIETSEGRTHDAWARVTNLVHPEVLATQGCGGGWAKGHHGRDQLQRLADHRRRAHRLRLGRARLLHLGSRSTSRVRLA